MTSEKNKPGQTSKARDILDPGRNCLKTARASRVAFLIDGADYFSAFRAAAMQAQRSIYIVGWDIHSSTRLAPEDEPEDGLPAALGDFLNALVKQSKELEVHVLAWDFAMIYALDREFLPLYRPAWSSHRRVHFKLDANHPTGGSHHQKIVVIDDTLAFVGGLDLTTKRWDTSEHRPGDPRRVTPQNESYNPFHDLEMLVEGDVAREIGSVVRKRWRDSGARPPQALPGETNGDLWPESIEAAARDVEVAIALTQPAFNNNLALQQIKQLYLDAIANAQRFIYIENQYLTSAEIVNALVDRLSQADGPEIIILSRSGGGGWLEEMTMSVLRARLLKKLRAADNQQRLGAFYPHHKGFSEGEKIDLHSKLMIIDDRFVQIGSANLANRSMGYDSECDLAFEAQTEAQTEAIRALRRRLLSEHLGTEAQRLAEQEQQKNSLLAVIESLRGGERTLERLPDEIDEDVDDLVPEADLLDPEQPIDPNRLAGEMLPPDHRRFAESRLSLVTALIVGISVLVMLWHWTPLDQWLHLENLREVAETIRSNDLAPLLVAGGFLLAAFGLLPVMLLVVATVAIFGPWLGLAYSWVGLLLGALIGLALGRLLPRDLTRRLAGKRLNRVSRRLTQGGLRAILAVRLVPIAPFPVVNLVAGASRVRVRHFFLGTLIGTLPGLIALILVADRIRAVIHQRDLVNFSLLGATLLLVVIGALVIFRWLKRLDFLEKGRRDEG